MGTEQFSDIHRDFTIWVDQLLSLKGQFYTLIDFFITGYVVFVVHILFRLYTTLIFGVSFCQFLIGINSNESPLWSRVGGVARVLLEFLLGPFIIFDLPLLVGKKSLKEMLTFSNLSHDHKVTSFFTSAILIPALVLLAIFSPVFSNLQYVTDIKVLKENLVYKKLSEKSEFSNFNYYSSEYFKFNSFSNLDDLRFLVIPSFSLVQETSKKRVIPTLKFYDKKLKTIVSFSLVEHFSLFNILKSGLKGDLFYSSNYSNLKKALNRDNAIYKVRAYDPTQGLEKIITKEVSKEIEEYLLTSFKLSVKNMLWHLFDYGPFIKGYILVRNLLLDKLDVGGLPVIDMVPLGNFRFLKIKQHFFQLDSSKTVVESFIPINTFNVLSFSLETEESAVGTKSLHDFKSTFFSEIEWYFDYHSIFKYPDSKDLLNPVIISDYLVTRDIQLDKRADFEDYLYNHFFSLGKTAFLTKDLKLKTILIKNLRRMVDVMKLKNKVIKNYYSKNIFSLLKSLITALESGNGNFFGE